jgi:hypothetical protein
MRYPWDLMVVSVPALFFYYWGVATGYPASHLAKALPEGTGKRENSGIIG